MAPASCCARRCHQLCRQYVGKQNQQVRLSCPMEIVPRQLPCLITKCCNYLRRSTRIEVQLVNTDDPKSRLCPPRSMSGKAARDPLCLTQHVSESTEYDDQVARGSTHKLAAPPC